MGRSNWKLKYLSKSLISKIIKNSTGVEFKGKNSLIANKSSYIPEIFIDNILYIHNGYRYRELKIKKFHIGFKFGEFILTRKPCIFFKKSKVLKKNIRK